ncbi:cytochrome P450 [Kitasatospora kifunensis]|uniref:cytochrome P450 n=1 Tax=Kitasatospora kifunensis TaxID=58351 RepID=UPI00160AD5F1|nr:cytochrome P450 [Kitasatospora kifunensis]
MRSDDRAPAQAGAERATTTAVPSPYTSTDLPGALPLLGHAPQFARSPAGFLAALPAHGDLVRIRLGTHPAYVVCHPTLVHQLLIADRSFDKGGPIYDKLREVAGNGVGTCPAAVHRRQRRLVQPAFHRDRMPGHAQVMGQEVAALTSSWQHGQILDVPDAMHRLTTAVVVRCLFDPDTDTPGVLALQSSIDAVVAGITRRMTWPLPLIHQLPTPANRRYARARLQVRHLTDGLISHLRSTGAGHDNLMSLLLAPDTDGAFLSDTEVHDQVVTFLVAGVGSTAITLSWAWHLIGTHPDIQTRLHAEADAVLAGRPAQLTDLNTLELTGRIVTETLRLYPPDSLLLTRTTSTDTELGGHPLPTGTTVAFSPYQLHRRADIYPDPDRFAPDRWKDIDKPPPGTWVPFGGGPRKCIADTFVRIQATLALATVAARWQLRPVPGQTIRPVGQTVRAPHRLAMRLHRRRPTPHGGETDSRA